jgi:hypothetical protein
MFLAKLHDLAVYSIDGAPLWIVALMVAFPIADQLAKRAKSTTAEGIIELLSRFVLKIPVFGAAAASVPAVGDALHKIANDPAVPPTLLMRVKAMKKAPEVKPPAAAALVLVFAALSLSSCTASQVLAWRTFGVDVAKCAGKGVADAAGSALIDLMKSLSMADSVSSLDPAALGGALAAKYGPEAALCALGKVASDLLPAAGLHAAPNAQTKLLQGMIDTQKTWAVRATVKK